MKSRILDRIFFLSAILLFLSTSISLSQSWNALGSGITGKVNASIVFNGQLVAGGEFTSPAGNVAVWNGTSWQTLGTGLNGVVYGFTIYNTQLIAVGAFNSGGNNVSRWNGSNWSGLGLGTNDTVYTAAVYQSLLRIGGKFTSAGGLNCNRVAGWNGTQWTAMGSPNGTNNSVYALTTFNSELILAGDFTSAGNLVSVNRIVRYRTDGTYAALGTGIDNNKVLSLAVYQNQLYAGGNFTSIGGITVNNIARWNGSNWNTVLSGTNGTVSSFGIQGTNLIVGGSFTGIGNSIASWNGSAFSALGNGITGTAPSVNSVTVWSNILVASGIFSNAGLTDVPVNNVAAYGSVPATPTLVSPADGATGVALNVTLDWSDVTLATSYGAQVSTNPNFTTFILNTSGLSTSSYTFPPQTPLINNTTYFWRANASNGLGTSGFSLVRFFTTGLVGIVNSQEIPLAFKLYQNYPNPFNPATKIRFDLPSSSNSGKIELSIFDITGKEVKKLLSTDYSPGLWELEFDASDLPSGLYLYRVNAGDFTAVNKMILMK